MNTKMRPYYVSRTIFSVLFGALFFATGSPLWEAALIGGAILALFIWAPHSGRYSVHPEFGISALRRDEWTQAVNDKAARNAFVAIMLMAGAASVYFGALGAASIPVVFMRGLLITGTLVYFGSDFWMRKSKQ